MDALLVELTAEDISKGTDNCFLACPFARAFKRLIPEAIQVEALPFYVIVRLPERKARYFETPADARSWMQLFEYGFALGPARFTFQEYEP